ncbi:MAG: NRDE family protein [Leptospiraceae bacterium]|nr:NRDE family protein [Leptospiraceae bacterium]
MCSVFLAWRCVADYDLILAANRDEFYERPTRAMYYWPRSGVYAGRDKAAGGTWLGVHPGQAKWGVVTNFRDPQHMRSDARSRGTLLATYLKSEQSPLTFAADLGLQPGPDLSPDAGQPLQEAEGHPRPSEYNGFNLLLGFHSELYYLSNQSGTIHLLQPGIYGLSNAWLNTPWPKVTKGRSQLKALSSLNGRGLEDPEQYWQFLTDQQIARDHLLPHTGVGLERERLLSALFIDSAVYGTRSSNVLWIKSDGQARVVERTWQVPLDSSGRPKASKDVEFSFLIPALGRSVSAVV